MKMLKIPTIAKFANGNRRAISCKIRWKWINVVVEVCLAWKRSVARPVARVAAAVVHHPCCRRHHPRTRNTTIITVQWWLLSLLLQQWCCKSRKCIRPRLSSRSFQPMEIKTTARTTTCTGQGIQRLNGIRCVGTIAQGC